MTIQLDRLAALVRNVAGYVAIVAGAIPVTDLPASVRVPLVATGGALLTAEHAIAKVLSYIDAKTPASTASTDGATPTSTTVATNPFAAKS